MKRDISLKRFFLWLKKDLSKTTKKLPFFHMTVFSFWRCLPEEERKESEARKGQVSIIVRENGIIKNMPYLFILKTILLTYQS